MATTSTLTGKAYVQLLANRNDTQDLYTDDYKVVRKDMITEMGDKITFRNIANRLREHGGTTSDIKYTDFIEEVHVVKRLNEKDNVIKSGLMTMEDIKIEAPYDTALKDETEYHYRNIKYTVVFLDIADPQGTDAFKIAYGKKIPQQSDTSGLT